MNNYPNAREKKFKELKENRCAWCGNEDDFNKSLPVREHGETWIYCLCLNCKAEWGIRK